MCNALKISFFIFFFNDTATTEIYTLSLHDALPISGAQRAALHHRPQYRRAPDAVPRPGGGRSEEHTSELQSRFDLVCRLLLEKKKTVFASSVRRVIAQSTCISTDTTRSTHTTSIAA